MALDQKDFDQIEKIVDERIEEKIKNLPTKDEFFSKMDEVMGELQAMREENTVGSHQLSEHEDRLTSLEEIHPAGRHATD